MGEVYRPDPPVAVLKGVGIDLTSIGRVVPERDDTLLRAASATGDTYALVIVQSDGRLAGAVLIGHPGPGRLAVTAMHGDRDPRALVSALGPQLSAVPSRQAPWLPPPTPVDSGAAARPTPLQPPAVSDALTADRV